MSFPASKPANWKGTIAAYAKAIHKQPGWAIRRTVKDFIAGKVSRQGQAFIPSTAELNKRCDELTQEKWSKLVRLRNDEENLRQRAADYVSPEEQERRQKFVARLREKGVLQ